MTITYSVDTTNRANGIGSSATTTTGSMSVASGDVIAVVLVLPDQNDGGTGSYSISNSGTALTWASIADVNVAGNCRVMGWWARAGGADASFTATVTQPTSTDAARTIYTIVHTGALASGTAVPAGKTVTGSSTTDVSATITPTDANGSALWMVCADWGQTNSFAARTNCTLQSTVNRAGLYTNTLIRPTTQPRPDGAAFTIGETDTGGTIAYVGFEVLAAGGGAAVPKRAMLLGVG